MTQIEGFRRNILTTKKDRRRIMLQPSHVKFIEDEFVNGSYRKYFGMSLTEALSKGYQLPVLSVFESTNEPAAIHTAKTLNILLDQIRFTDQRKILDGFTGSAECSWAFFHAGFSVTTVEMHDFTHMLVEQNLKLAGIADNIKSIKADTTFFLKEAVKNNDTYASIYLDPPWNEKYDYDLTKTFILAYMTPTPQDLLIESLKVAPLVALKVPVNIDKQEIKELGKLLKCQIIFHYHEVINYPPHQNAAVVYFIKGKNGYSEEHISLEI